MNTTKISKKRELRRLYTALVKNGPPGPKPDIYGDDVIWDEESHHWVLPDDIEGEDIGDMTRNNLQVLIDDALMHYKDRDFDEAQEMIRSMYQEVMRFGFPKQTKKLYMERLHELDVHIADTKYAYYDMLRDKGPGLSQRGFTLGAFETILEDWEAYWNPHESYAFVDKDDYVALDDYVTDGYTYVNDWLRSGRKGWEDEEVYGDMREELQDSVETLIGLSKPLYDDYPLYRGISTPLEKFVNAKPGDEFENKCFMSTSSNPDIAVSFAHPSGSIMMEIHPKTETKGIVLDTTEAETILGINQKFRVKEVYNNVYVGDNRIRQYMVIEAV